MVINIHISIYIYIYIFFPGEKGESAELRESSSFISLGLVYPPPQPLISKRPWQCRSSANGRHSVLKRNVGEGTHVSKVQSFANSVL